VHVETRAIFFVWPSADYFEPLAMFLAIRAGVCTDSVGSMGRLFTHGSDFFVDGYPHARAGEHRHRPPAYRSTATREQRERSGQGIDRQAVCAHFPETSRDGDLSAKEDRP
jgi:hypothetical protein